VAIRLSSDPIGHRDEVESPLAMLAAINLD
jgi:hypothetical protein